ncbi:hypothetical protein ABZ611_12500 [Streptomyces sp. NPDC007861]|uniref:hypothetical protein n=1 Tax=Streptomyces sp. NPDC007861 TaxID=3154893 RepID=UPI0033DBC7BF
MAAAYAADELLRHRGSKRPARVGAAVGGSLLVAICCWAGGSAVRDLALGRDTDWFGLGLGILGGGLAVVGVLSWRTERYERRARNEHNERDERDERDGQDGQDERSAAGSAY